MPAVRRGGRLRGARATAENRALRLAELGGGSAAYGRVGDPVAERFADVALGQAR